MVEVTVAVDHNVDDILFFFLLALNVERYAAFGLPLLVIRIPDQIERLLAVAGERVVTIRTGICINIFVRGDCDRADVLAFFLGLLTDPEGTFDQVISLVRMRVIRGAVDSDQVLGVEVLCAGLRGIDGGLLSLLCNEENVVICLRAKNHIAACIETLDIRVVASNFRPADKRIALFQNICCQQFLRSCLNRSNGNGVRANVVRAVHAMQCAGKGLLLPQVVLVALRVDAVINVQDIAVDLRVIVSGGCTLEIVISSVLTVSKERGAALVSCCRCQPRKCSQPYCCLHLPRCP